MAKEKFGLKDITEEIDETFNPLELVSLYIIWKNEEIEDIKLKEDLKAFIDYLTPEILEKMTDHCIKLDLIKKDKDENFTLP